MATEKEMEQLQQARDLAGGQEELQDAIQDRGQTEEFINQFGNEDQQARFNEQQQERERVEQQVANQPEPEPQEPGFVPEETFLSEDITGEQEPASQDNIITNQMVDRGELPEAQRENVKQQPIEQVDTIEKQQQQEVIQPEAPQPSPAPIPKTKEEEIREQELEQDFKQKQKDNILNEFQKLVTGGAGVNEIAEYVNNNPEYKKDYNVILKNQIKDKANTDFYRQYAGMNNEAMLQATKNGDLIVGSEQYKILPEGQRQRFEQYKKQTEATEITSKTQFNELDNLPATQEMQRLEKEITSFDIMEEIQKVKNNPQITSVSNRLSNKKAEIEKLDIEMEDIDERIRREYAGNLPAVINGVVRDRKNDLVKQKRLMLAEYNADLAQYNNLQSSITQDIQLLQYEDQRNRQMYEQKLSIYESRRGEMKAEERAQFEAIQKEASYQRDLLQKKELILFQEQINATKGGQYLDDGQGNLQYVKDGEVISTLEGLGETKDVTDDENYTYQIKQNDDGGYSVFGLPKKDGMNILHKTYDITGEEANQNWLETVGSGAITSYGGEHDNYQGLDIDGKIGDPITLPLSGKVISVENHKMYGKTAVIELEDKNRIRLSHLNDTLVNVGEDVAAGNVIGTIGNTGNVKKMNGETPSKEEMNQGFGSHLDIVTYDSTGKARKSTDTEKYLKSITAGQQGLIDLTRVDINKFNNTTFKPQDIKTTKERNKYEEFLRQKELVMGDRNSTMEDILKYSSGGGPITQTSTSQLEKFNSVISQLGSIQEQIQGMDTGPVLGKLANLNAYDTDAQVLKAQLTALIPNLARGVYGEVGVLTDNDVRLYSRTIPNLESTAEVNDAILAMTLKVVGGGYKRQLQTLAASNKDVSGFQGLYDNVMGQVKSLETGLGIGSDTQEPQGNYTTKNNFTIDYNDFSSSIQTEEKAYNNFFNQ